MSVVDVVEAMASHRPARGIKAALEEIERNSGILYATDVVPRVLSFFERKNLSLKPKRKITFFLILALLLQRLF